MKKLIVDIKYTSVTKIDLIKSALLIFIKG